MQATGIFERRPLAPPRLILRAVLVVSAVAVYRVSDLVEPVYRAWPRILLEPVSLLVPPGSARSLLETLAFLALLWVGETLLYRRYLALPWKEAWSACLRTYSPVLLLGAFGILFVPGLPGIPPLGWGLVLDGASWLV
ncbi:MAG: hypothetical protein ACE5JI_15435, partial [Acidobacteriota bacterium]